MTIEKKGNLRLRRCKSLYQDLSYGEILPGWPGAWLVKKNIFYMHAIKKMKKGSHVEIQNDFQNMFKFYDSLYGL